MSIFGRILEKLGIAPAPAQAAAPQAAPTSSSPVAPSAAPAVAPRPTAISAVDVVAKSDGLAAASKEKLNWKVSIVDLMKLLGLDSSLTDRKALATELGCPADNG